MLNSKNIKAIFIIIISLLSAYLFFYKLGAAPVELWDENTNIKVVNSTLSSSDKRALQIDGEAFYEKPPVWYYLTEVLVTVFGESRYVYRLISAVSGVVISICIFLIVNKKYSPLSSFIASLSFLAVGQNIITNSSGYFSSHTFRSADLDPLQIALMVLSILFLLNIDRSKNYFYLL
ncbi:glycosyltransferase family 39 protein, partial [Candidatus Dojkabacteria bacterium]|nr:glycosyltransferase family 39 protein [Candidatus Dojkabacteria bacterium]